MILNIIPGKKENTAYFELFMKYLLIVYKAADEMSKKFL